MRKQAKAIAVAAIAVVALLVTGWLSGKVGVLHPRLRPGDGMVTAAEMADMPGMSTSSTESTGEEMDMSSGDHAGHGGGTAPLDLAGMADMPTAMISADMQQLFGIRKARPMMMDLSKDLTTFGVVEYDESGLKFVTTRYSGWVTDIFADYTGIKVAENEVIAKVYSPEIYTASEELLLAAQARERLKDSAYPDVAMGSRSLFDKAWRRLELLGLSRDQIQDIVDSGESVEDLPVYATVSGTVIKKMVSQGSRVSAGDPLYQVADLSRVWLIASFYEADAPHIQMGETATISFDRLPGESYSGRVSFVYPNLDPATRTLRVRFNLNMPEGQVQPGMFANVKLRLNLGHYMVVPEDAVMDTGVRQLVFVEMSEGHFMGHEVVAGPTANGYTAILSGITASDQIVTDSGFFVDAESKIRASMGGMEHMGH
jgi:Cu(I)/Ag(I) efflux system membrane fusion protein